MLGQTGEGLDFIEIMDRRRLALFDLSGLGRNNAQLLGSLLLLLLRQATMRRGPDGIAPMHFVLIDEASLFLSRTVAELLDQARKFGVGLVIAVQRVGQLTPEDVREAVMANAASTLTFRLSDREEAALLARHFGGESLQAEDIQRLPRFEAYMQVTQGGDRLAPAWLEVASPSESGTRKKKWPRS
jgi:DNA helicase HerA-like ATPase